MHAHEPDPDATGAPAELSPAVGDELDNLVGDPAATAGGVPRNETSDAALLGSVPPGTDGLPIQAEPRRCWPDSVLGRVLQNRQTSLHLPSIPAADRAIEHEEIPLSGLACGYPSPPGVPFQRKYVTGWKLLREAKPLEAEAALDEALRLDATVATSHATLGSVYASTGRLDDAVRELRVAKALDPQLMEARINLGLVLLAGCGKNG